MKLSDGTKSAVRSLGEFTLSSVLVTALRIPVRIVKSALFVRILGPQSMGVYRLFLTVPSLIVSFGNMGFGLGCIYLLAKKKADVRRVLGNALLYVFLYGPVMAAVGMAALALAGNTVAEGAAGMAGFRVYVFVSVPLLLALNVGLNLLMGVKSIHLMNALDLVTSALPVGVVLLLWWMLGNALPASVWSWIVATAVVAAAAFLRVLGRSGGGMPGVSGAYLKEAFSFGLRGNLSNFAGEVVRKVDVLFVAHYWGMKEVGYYAVSVSVAELLLSLPDTVAGPFMPVRFEMEKKDGHAFSALVLRVVMFVMFAVCGATAVLGGTIIRVLYGAEFLPALRAMQFLLPGMLALSVYQFLRAEIYSHDRPGFVSWIAFLTMVCNLALNWLWIPRHGIVGAAASSSVSYSLSSIALLVFFLRHSGLRASDALVMRRRDFRLLWELVRSYLVRKPKRSGAPGEAT